jgi:hypothetical protein
MATALAASWVRATRLHDAEGERTIVGPLGVGAVVAGPEMGGVSLWAAGWTD